jgi:hypothetical protein
VTDFYLAFLFIGLGMALPYLIGRFRHANIVFWFLDLAGPLMGFAAAAGVLLGHYFTRK